MDVPALKRLKSLQAESAWLTTLLVMKNFDNNVDQGTLRKARVACVGRFLVSLTAL